jgi:hypothetical protein
MPFHHLLRCVFVHARARTTTFSETVGMEENVNKTNSIDEFVSDFDRFYNKILEKVKELDDEQVVTLYAIYLKNGRAEAMNGNGNGYGYQKKPKSDPNASATDRQRELIRKLVEKGRVKFEGSINLETLTKKRASEILDKVFGTSPSKWRKSSTSFCSNLASVVSSGNHPKSGLEPLKYGQN